jgi:hypothetical protein
MSDQSGNRPSRPGDGVDLTLIRAMLALTPTERIARLTQEAAFLRTLDRARESARRQEKERRARADTELLQDSQGEDERNSINGRG